VSLPGERLATSAAVPRELLRAPRRSEPLAFTLTISLLMLLGAVAMAVVLVASNAPKALEVGVVLAAVPVGPVVAAYLWLDRYEPEPIRLLGFAFGWGALVATSAALLLQAVDEFAFQSNRGTLGTVVAPLTEEAAKGFFILLLLWLRRAELDGILDGLVYAGLVGVGFAFTENILYLGSAYMGGHDAGPGGFGAATGLFVVRGVFSPFAHPLFTSFTGIGVGYAVVTRSRFWRFFAPVLGYAVAVIAHATWNSSLLIHGGHDFVLTYVFLMVPAFLLVVAFAIWARAREGRMLTRSLSECAAAGYLDAAQVPWLVRLPARRASRRYAARVGGRGAAAVMREYQQQAVELGFLHDRARRGTAPADFVARRDAMVRRLAALRPYAIFPKAYSRGEVPR
jgi:RsiW-degrading membrane proteinase PrsW (M82 family)